MEQMADKSGLSYFVRRQLYTFTKHGGPGTVAAVNARGWLAESWVFDRLEAAGVPNVRSFETAPVDGGFMRDPPPNWTTMNHLERLFDLNSKCLWFDVRYYEYCVDQQGKHYRFRPMTGIHQLRPVAAYIIKFQDIDDAIAIVPRAVYEASTDASYDTLPLMSEIMNWCAGFMVQLSDVRVAVERILKVGSDWYTNPSTGMTMHEWRPESSKETDVTLRFPPTDQRIDATIHQTRRFYAQVNSASASGSCSSARLDLNPVAPLLGDCILRLDGVEMPLMIELKYGTKFADGRKSPYWKHRAWHFLIIELKPQGFLCYGRHQVKPEWASDHAAAMTEASQFLGPHATVEMIQFIQIEAQQAIAAAVAAVASARPEDLELGDLVSSASDLVLYKHLRDEDDGSVLQLRTLHAGKTLPWVYGSLLDQCCKDGQVIVFPLDMGHPWGNYAAFKYCWSADEKENFERSASDSRRLPVQIWDSHLRDAPCLVMRFLDFSGGDSRWGTNSNQFYPASMRRANWLHPLPGRAFWNLASVLPRSANEVFDSYLLLPSSATAQGDFELRKSLSGVGDERCAKFFVKESIFKYHICTPRKLSTKLGAGSSRPIAMKRGSVFLSTGVEPLQHLVKIGDGTVYRHIRQLLIDPGLTMSIQPLQTNVQNGTFSKAQYLTTGREVQQSAWDYGLLRKPWKKGGPSQGTDDLIVDVASLVEEEIGNNQDQDDSESD